MLIFFIMLIMGLLLGFIGAGGSGFIIAILTTFFGIPIHIALGTSLSAMVFTSLSGTYSHYREKNVVIRIGFAAGLFGIIGAFFGSRIAHLIPDKELEVLTAFMLFLSALLIWLRLFTQLGLLIEKSEIGKSPSNFYFWISASGIGIITGMLSGIFGIGAAPFIQIGLLLFFNLSIQQSVGTTLFIILPIAFIGGLSYYTIGNLDILLLINVAAGTTIGSYVGAKFTNRLNPLLLKNTIVIVPLIGGLILFFGK